MSEQHGTAPRVRTAAWALAVAALVAGCAGAASAADGSPATGPAGYDAAVLTAHREPVLAIARAGTPRAADGLLGRNAEWGGMYSARFQTGAGAALRTHLLAGDAAGAELAFAGVAAGIATIGDDGAVPSSLPPDRFPGASLTDGDVASGAAFFLGDACLGVSALRASERPDAVADAATVDAAVGRLALAARWLQQREGVLQAYDRAAPNRLLFDAVAFRACGALAGDDGVTATARPFADAALTLLDPAGSFVEGGGSDTGYQAVAIVEGHELLIAGYADPALDGALTRASAWLRDRVGDDGLVDSTGNTRTCGGGESFLGVAKRIDPKTVFRALSVAAVHDGDPRAAEAADRVYAWSTTHPGEDPCHPR